MSLLLKSVIRLRGKPASISLDHAAANPEAAQRRFLFRTLRRNAETAFGQAHGFASIRTEADFQKQVPIQDYEGFRPYVNRIIEGERGVLTAVEPLMLTMTSGTTGEPKFIPVTCESRRSDSGLMLQWLARALGDHPALMDHAGVGIVGRAVEGVTPAGLPFGSASGFTYKNLPWLVRRTHAVPYPVAEIDDYDERYFVTARLALGARVSCIATPNPGTLLRLAEICIEHEERLMRAIHDGTLGTQMPAQPDLFARLTARLKPDRARARALARVVKREGFLKPSDCWPDLQLVACWVGGSVRLQARRLSAYYGDVPIRDLGYMASEGHFTVPFEDDTPSGIPALRSSFFEFLPEEETDSAQPLALRSHELEEGRRYSIVLTTAAGLYRYRIGDVVEVTGFHRRSPLLAFLRKEGEMANIVGEKLHVNHLLLAVESVCRQFSLAIKQFRATPDFEKNRYDLYLEMDRDVSDDTLRDVVLPELDRALTRVNIEYAQKRRSRRLHPLCLRLMMGGWAESARRRQVAVGGRDIQYKWKIICPEPRPEDLAAIARTIEAVDDSRAAAVSTFEPSGLLVKRRSPSGASGRTSDGFSVACS